MSAPFPILSFIHLCHVRWGTLCFPCYDDVSSRQLQFLDHLHCGRQLTWMLKTNKQTKQYNTTALFIFYRVLETHPPHFLKVVTFPLCSGICSAHSQEPASPDVDEWSPGHVFCSQSPPTTSLNLPCPWPQLLKVPTWIDERCQAVSKKETKHRWNEDFLDKATVWGVQKRRRKEGTHQHNLAEV